MLYRLGPYDEEGIVNQAKVYLPVYGQKEKEQAKVPFIDVEDGSKKKFLVFTWLAGQWVFTDTIT